MFLRLELIEKKSFFSICKTYLSKLSNVFVQIVESIFPNCHIYFPNYIKTQLGIENVLTVEVELLGFHWQNVFENLKTHSVQ